MVNFAIVKTVRSLFLPGTQVAKRTAVQEQIILPLRAQNYAIVKTVRSLFLPGTQVA